MFHVYMLASAPHGTLYVGQTSDLIDRVRQHREKELRGFSARYGVSRLVWYEEHASREAAFARERQIKKWYRAWKVRVIQAANPEWRDLYDELLTPEQPLHPDLHGWAAEQASMDPRMRGDDRELGND